MTWTYPLVGGVDVLVSRSHGRPKYSEETERRNLTHILPFLHIKVLNDCRVYNYINSVPSIELFTTSTARHSERKNKSQSDKSQETELDWTGVRLFNDAI